MHMQDVFEDLKGRISAPQSGFAPLYHKVQSALRNAIEQGDFAIGSGLPSERDLADGLGVSRVTVRNALRGLVDEGLLESRQGAGTFVRPRYEMTLKVLSGFSEDMRARGLKATSRLIDMHSGMATPREREVLNLTPDEDVTRIYRLRSAAGKPLSVELAVLPATVISADTDFGMSLYEFLNAQGMRPVYAVQRLRAELLEIEQALLLEVMPGSAGLFVERQTFLDGGRPIEYVRSHFRGDAYDFVAELKL